MTDQTVFGDNKAAYIYIFGDNKAAYIYIYIYIYI